MCQSTGTMLGDGDRRVDRHVLRNTQRKLKMEAVLGSPAAPAADRLRTPSPQLKSILSRNQNHPADKENSAPGVTPPNMSRLSANRSTAGPSSPSPTKTTPLMGTTDPKRSLRYTSLSELVVAIPNSAYNRSDSFGASSQGGAAPRTPMKDALVEKAVQAYLQPSESFNARTRSSGWGMCLVVHQFLPSFLTKFSFAIPNPLQFFCCAVHAFSIYVHGEGNNADSDLSNWRRAM